MHVIPLLKSLLPRGLFWEVEKDSVMDLLIKAMSRELERVQLQADCLSDYPSQVDYQVELAKRLRVPVAAIPLLMGPKGPLTLERWQSILSAFGYPYARIQDDSLEATAISHTSGQVSLILPNVPTEFFRAGGEAGECLGSWSAPDFENLVHQIKPLLVQPEFIYPTPQGTHRGPQEK